LAPESPLLQPPKNATAMHALAIQPNIFMT